jgi:hypothetical protein
MEMKKIIVLLIVLFLFSPALMVPLAGGGTKVVPDGKEGLSAKEMKCRNCFAS